MKAIACVRLGTPEDLEVREIPHPVPGAGQVKLQIRAAGVNYADLLVISGSYQEKQQVPFIPGSEVAGEIVEVGSDVRGWAMGSRVAALVDNGGYAEFAVVDASRLYAVPQAMSLEQAAASFIAFGTAYGSLKWRAKLEPGEVCLVLGGAGGVGLASISTAKAMGAMVIGAASSAERCALMAQHGADFTIDYAQGALKDKVLSLTDSKGADVIIDPVGGDLGSQALRCIAWSGRIVTLGFPSGKIPQYPANILLVKNVAVQGMYFGSYVAKRPDLVKEAMAFVWRGFLDGSVKPIAVTLGELGDIPNLLTKLKERKQLGKAVVVP